MFERNYEILFLIDVIDFSKTQEEILNLISSHNGKIFKQEELGIKDFAYPIQKKKKGFYFFVHVNFSSDSLALFSKEIKMKENVLRFLSVLLKDKKYIRRGKRKLAVIEGQIKRLKNKKDSKDSLENVASSESNVSE